MNIKQGFITSNTAIFEQLNLSSLGIIQFYAWSERLWEYEINNDEHRVAIFKPKGSTIKTQPNK